MLIGQQQELATVMAAVWHDGLNEEGAAEEEVEGTEAEDRMVEDWEGRDILAKEQRRQTQ